MSEHGCQTADFLAELGQPVPGFGSSVPVLHSEFPASSALAAMAKSFLTDVTLADAACDKPCRHSSSTYPPHAR